MGEAENPGKLGPQLPGTALMAMILPETGVHPGNVGLAICANNFGENGDAFAQLGVVKARVA